MLCVYVGYVNKLFTQTSVGRKKFLYLIWTGSDRHVDALNVIRLMSMRTSAEQDETVCSKTHENVPKHTGTYVPWSIKAYTDRLLDDFYTHIK